MDTFSQKILFDKIREKLPSENSLVLELSDLLEISTDSSYRRIRGQTKVSFEEAVVLARKFNLSLDEMYQRAEGSIPFIYKGVDYNIQSLEEYYRGLVQEFGRADMMTSTNAFYATKDIPMFHSFAFPKLAAFRLYFWQKMIYDLLEMKGVKFDFDDDRYKNIIEMGKRALIHYNKIPSTEIWCEEVLSAIVNPILYFYESGDIPKRSTALELLDEVDTQIKHIQYQAELGKKFLPNTNTENLPENFKLFFNEVTITNNNIILESEGKRYAYLGQNALDYLMTDNEAFAQRLKQWFTTLSKKS
ncbi:MAG: hypothetical protein ACPG5P_08615, partial [Saprospiraceae bacterium]